MTTRRQKLVIEVEGDPAPGLTAPIYAMTEEICTALFDGLAQLGWRVVSYGDETEGGSFKAYPDNRTPEERYAARVEGRKWSETIRESLARNWGRS